MFYNKVGDFMKNKLSLFYKILIVVVSSIALCLNFKVIPFKQNILYFTIQSNLLCFIFYLVIVILKMLKKEKKNNFYYIIKGMVTMAITITMVVFQMVIATNSLGIYENHLFECYLVHIVVPLLVIFDYIIFGEKGNLKKSYPFIWSLILVFYTIFTSVYAFLGGKFIDGTSYPYFYMNIDKYGILRVSINCVIVYICFVVYGMIIQKLDNKLATESK